MCNLEGPARRGQEPESARQASPPVNRCLENPTSDKVLPVADAPAPDCADGAPVAADAVAVKKGRVLLLEDDDSFREIITDFLTENGYKVVAVQNGGEGVREVLNGEFSLILCDLMMPTLPGDMFYRAVERICPRLCKRFVFMSGHRNDEKMNAFIKSIGSSALRKPFPLDHLLDLFAFAEVCETYESVCNLPSDDPPVRPRPARVPEAARPRPQPVAPAMPIAVEPPQRAPGVSLALVGLALPIALSVVLGFQYLDAQADAAAAVAQRVALETECEVLAPQFEAARGGRPKLERSLGALGRITAERARPRWTPALRSIAVAAGKQIDLIDIRAQENSGNAGTCEVRVRGLADGAEPRSAADRFRQVVEEGLKKDAPGRQVSARFQLLEDAPGDSPGQKCATFIIVATVGPAGREEP